MKILVAFFAIAFLAGAQSPKAASKKRVVRYQLEYREMTESVIVHFDSLLTQGSVSFMMCENGYERQNTSGCALYKDLLNVPGVQEVSINRYQVEIKGDVLFIRQEVADGVVKVVQAYLHADEMHASPPIVPSGKDQASQHGCSSLPLVAAN